MKIKIGRDTAADFVCLGLYGDELEGEAQRRFGVFELFTLVQFLGRYFSAFFCWHGRLLGAIGF